MSLEVPAQNDRLWGRSDNPEVICLRLVCEIKGVSYQFKPRQVDFEQPDGEPIWESGLVVVSGFSPIVEFLEGRWLAPEMLPYRRSALNLVWEYIDFLKKDLLPNVELFLKTKNSRESFEIKTDVERMLSRLEADLGQRNFLVADQWTLADIFAYVWIRQMFCIRNDPLPVSKFPNLAAWCQRLEQKGLNTVSIFPL